MYNSRAQAAGKLRECQADVIEPNSEANDVSEAGHSRTLSGIGTSSSA